MKRYVGTDHNAAREVEGTGQRRRGKRQRKGENGGGMVGGSLCWERGGRAAGTVHWASEDRQLLWDQGSKGLVWKPNCRLRSV